MLAARLAIRLAGPLAPMALALGLAAAPAPSAIAPVAGPPLLCFPIDAGGAEMVPFGDSSFNVNSDRPTEELVAKALALLEKSDDPLVHMETLRRIAILFMSREEAQKKGTTTPATFRAQLAEAVLVAAAAPGEGAPRRAEALRWFDLGYFHAAARQGGVLESVRERDDLEKAARLAPDDVALQFGVGLAEYFPADRDARDAWAAHLAKLVDAKTPPELVKKNALATLGAFLDAHDWEKLGAEVRKRLGRS